MRWGDIIKIMISLNIVDKLIMFKGKCLKSEHFNINLILDISSNILDFENFYGRNFLNSQKITLILR